MTAMPATPATPATPARPHRRLATLAALMAALAAAAVSAPGGAAAAPQLQLEQCIGLDRLELARSIESELSASPATANADDLVIATSCSDGVSAIVRVTERATRRQAERALALGEVTGELRPRLVALVAVELAESLLAAPRTVAAAFLPAPASARRGPALAVAPSAAALEAAPEAATEAAMNDEPTGEATRDEAPPPGLSSVFSGRPARRRALSFSLGVGTRVYFEKPEPMLQASLEVALRSITLGVVGAAAEAYHTKPPPFFGAPEEQIRYTSYLLGFSVRPQLYCLQAPRAGLCLDLHGEAGFTRVYAANVDSQLTKDDLRGQYLMAGTGVEARVLLASSLETALRLEAAVSDGDVIRTGDIALTAFNGALVMIHFGLRWMP